MTEQGAATRSTCGWSQSCRTPWPGPGEECVQPPLANLAVGSGPQVSKAAPTEQWGQGGRAHTADALLLATGACSGLWLGSQASAGTQAPSLCAGAALAQKGGRVGQWKVTIRLPSRQDLVLSPSSQRYFYSPDRSGSLRLNFQFMK